MHRGSNGRSKIRSLEKPRRNERKRLEDPDAAAAPRSGRRRRKPTEMRFPPVRRKKDEEIRGRMEKRREKEREREREREKAKTRNGGKREERPCLFPNGFYAATVVGGPSPSHDGDADDAAAASVSLGSRASEITGIQVSADRVVPRRRRRGGAVGGIPVEMLMPALCQIPVLLTCPCACTMARTYAPTRARTHTTPLAADAGGTARRNRIDTG